jgi:trehalose-phosphatase
MIERSTLALPSAVGLPWVEGWLGACPRGVAIFLDYDGTLTPIVSRPELATLSGAMRETIRRVAARFPVSVVSGRDIAVVAELVGIPELGYVGSHGLDIAGPPGSDLRKEVAIDFLSELDQAEAEVRARTGGIGGVIVERKRFSLSTHVRLVTPGERSRVELTVDEVQQAHPSLRREGGKMLLELRPDIDWDKGTAVRWLLDGLGLDLSAALFIGDDLTDETVFRVLAGRGQSVVVAESDRPTAANLRVRDPGEVQILLEHLSVAVPASGAPDHDPPSSSSASTERSS